MTYNKIVFENVCKYIIDKTDVVINEGTMASNKIYSLKINIKVEAIHFEKLGSADEIRSIFFVLNTLNYLDIDETGSVTNITSAGFIFFFKFLYGIDFN